MQSATNPVNHSHLYDLTVLLQTELTPQVSEDRHSSASLNIRGSRAAFYVKIKKVCKKCQVQFQMNVSGVIP